MVRINHGRRGHHLRPPSTDGRLVVCAAAPPPTAPPRIAATACTQHDGRHDRVGVDEHQQVRPRLARPGIARRRDVPHAARVTTRAPVLARDLRRPIRRPVVHDDDL